MELWQRVFRKGIAPQISRAALEALRDALVSDDPRLIQGTTFEPQTGSEDSPVVAACAIGFCGWHSGVTKADQLAEYFDDVLCRTDERLGDAHVGQFLSWFDETPRCLMRAGLLPEVEEVLRQRRLLELVTEDVAAASQEVGAAS